MWMSKGMLLLTLVCLVATQCPVLAASGSERAREMVAGAEKNEGLLLGLYPVLQSLDKAIRADCVAKVAGASSESDFCQCGAAMTIELWRADDTMRKRLTDFIKAGDASRARDLLKYQGPELYKPICILAEKSLSG